ncbi:conserved hypothetical protein [Ricinus communis]|uniref:Uncharacterized protein n=1 Tax=Ricinus communis TaxID=3988 RepID=B9SDS0_RICCO|nr:conserved hypothetical protein [Ricinus communis]
MQVRILYSGFEKVGHKLTSTKAEVSNTQTISQEKDNKKVFKNKLLPLTVPPLLLDVLSPSIRAKFPSIGREEELSIEYKVEIAVDLLNSYSNTKGSISGIDQPKKWKHRARPARPNAQEMQPIIPLIILSKQRLKAEPDLGHPKVKNSRISFDNSEKVEQASQKWCQP